MPRQLHRWPAVVAVVLAAGTGVAVWLAQRPAPPAVSGPSPPTRLSELAPPPDWSQLAGYHGTVTRAAFERAMDEVFTMSGAWRRWIEVGETEARIETGEREPFVLRFAVEGTGPAAPHRWWRPADGMGPAPADRPLAGVHVAIDPGHLGGQWGKMEERWFRVGNAMPVQEGDLTLAVARLLRPRLEQLGAKVTLVRETNDPLTTWRPQSLREAGMLQPDAGVNEEPRRLAERLFYATAEIRARARRVNEQIRPDLVLCLHLNAEEWGNPSRPTLVDRNHFHLLINGAFTDAEVALADQRCELLLRLLQRTHDEELALGVTAAKAFAELTGLPPYQYEAGSLRARNLGGTPYLWARNLLANRLYRCPVLFYEPYVMNSREVHARIQAGDYPGERLVAGALRPSLVREYADAVTEGLRRHYSRVRR